MPQVVCPGGSVVTSPAAQRGKAGFWWWCGCSSSPEWGTGAQLELVRGLRIVFSLEMPASFAWLVGPALI